LTASVSPAAARVITPHVIEALLSDGVEPVQKTGMRTRDVGAGLAHRTRISQMDRFILRQLSRFPVSASLWTDHSPANGVVTAVAIITSHVIELVSRSGVSEMIGCNTSKEEPARQRC
jgi:hypothetical protein